jgi:predicted ATPase
VAQIGAAIGRQFPYALLRAVSDLPEDGLRAALARLVASELVFQRGTPPDAFYTFKHALVQDAAHGSLLRTTRQQLHAQIAQALEAQSPELMDSQLEIFAQHYAEAGLVEKSAAYWGKAGHRSVSRSAMAEAAGQFQKALDQLAFLPDSSERRRQELEYCSALGGVLMAVKGHTAPETGGAYYRARELWEQLGAPTEFLHIAYGQHRYHLYRGEFELAVRLVEDLLRLSRQHDDAAGLVLGHHAAGRNLWFAGEFAAARSHLEKALAIHNATIERMLAHQVGASPRVNSMVVLAIVLLCLGHPEQAVALSDAAIMDARGLGHLPSLVAVLTLAGLLFAEVGDDMILAERLDELAMAVAEQSFPVWATAVPMRRGWLQVKNGDPIGGMALLRRGAAAFRATGTLNGAPWFFSLQAEACEIAEQFEEASTLLDEALGLVERTGERWYAAEINRRKGRLLLRQGDSAAAEALYCNALGIAAKQGAKLWELRAAASLARLRRDQGRRAEARDLLAAVYDWFTEGFNTSDLKDAKALLDELA